MRYGGNRGGKHGSYIIGSESGGCLYSCLSLCSFLVSEHTGYISSGRCVSFILHQGVGIQLPKSMNVIEEPFSFESAFPLPVMTSFRLAWNRYRSLVAGWRPVVGCGMGRNSVESWFLVFGGRLSSVLRRGAGWFRRWQTPTMAGSVTYPLLARSDKIQIRVGGTRLHGSGIIRVFSITLTSLPFATRNTV